MAATAVSLSDAGSDRGGGGTRRTQPVVRRIVVHPLVLLSVVDHYNRLAKVGNQRRVVGCLLGGWRARGVLDVSNSFAVPFDEDERDSSVWFLDHDYLETMYSMFKKVNAREKIVGWYHTGPRLHHNDVAINELVRRYCADCVLVVIDARPRSVGLPTEAYAACEEVHDDGTPTSRTFDHVATEIGAEEAEEVGVEHLLRDIKDTTAGTLAHKISGQLLGVKGLLQQVRAIRTYVQQVVDERLPVNHQIVYALQNIFNLLPDVSNSQLVRSLYVKTNDQMLVVYLAAIVRAVAALHNLINNKINNQNAEKKEIAAAKKDKQPSDKDKEKDKVDEKKDEQEKKDNKK